MAEETLRIRIDGNVFPFSMDTMTWGELAEIETIIGGPIDEVNLESAKGIVALAYVIARRHNELVTIDSIKALPMGAIELVDTPDPTLAGEPGEDANSGSQS